MLLRLLAFAPLALAGCSLDELTGGTKPDGGGGTAGGGGSGAHGGAGAATSSSSAGGAGGASTGGAGGAGGGVEAPATWSKRFGDGSDDQWANAVAVAPGGCSGPGQLCVVVVGQTDGEIDFGSGPLPAGGGFDAFVAAFDTDGAPLWSRRWGNGYDQVARGVAIDSAGNVHVTGYMKGTADFGGGLVTAAPLAKSDLFIVKLDASGALDWVKFFGQAEDVEGYGVAVDAMGRVVVTGTIEGTITFDGTNVTSAGVEDVLVFRLTAAGNPLEAAQYGNTSPDFGRAVAIASTGVWTVAGSHQKTISFGGGTMPNGGGSDVFAARWTPDAALAWQAHAGGSGGTQLARSVSVDAQGNAVIAGDFGGAFAFEGGEPLPTGGNQDVFVARLAAADGAPLWAVSAGGDLDQSARAVAVDAQGDAVLAGGMRNVLDFGGGPLQSAGDVDLFVAKLSAADGAPVWARRYGDVNEQWGQGVAVDDAGNAYVAGYFRGTLDMGNEPLVAVGETDVFLAKLPP
jgi:hypothetical protein